MRTDLENQLSASTVCIEGSSANVVPNLRVGRPSVSTVSMACSPIASEMQPVIGPGEATLEGAARWEPALNEHPVLMVYYLQQS